ncbi:MAG: hypothetical protein H0W88_03780 [Parachlamydiaceae bacterium]|nr:hypothetical protein [Parachlamydiaceae bacterium]
MPDINKSNDQHDMSQSFYPLYHKLVGDIPKNERHTTKVGLFVIADRTFVLTQIDLKDFLDKDKADQLHQWGKENRLAAVTFKGAEVFAHVSPQMSKQLDKSSLDIEGKKVVVKTLSDDEYAELSNIGEIARIMLEGEIPVAEAEEKVNETPMYERTSKASHSDMSYIQVVGMFLRMMGKIPEKIKMNILKRWQENLRDIEARKKEEAKEKQKKIHNIDLQQTDRSILKEQVKQKEIQEDLKTESIKKEHEEK